MTALITGASGGIGSDLAKLFAKDGYNLILIARRLEKLNELKSEIETNFKISVSVLALDLSVQDAPKTLYDFTVSNDFTIDVLVNNAGFGDFSLFTECNLKKQQQMIQLEKI